MSNGNRIGALIDHITATAGGEPASEMVEFIGEDPVFPTTFRIGELGAAAIGAAAVGAASIWERSTGQRQQVRVHVDTAAAGMRGYRYVRDEPQIGPVPPSQAVFDMYFPTRSGRWMYLQRLFPHHIARQLGVLGLPLGADDEATAAAVFEWDPRDLEDAVVAAGATGAFVRTREEWLAHDQAKAIAPLPLFEIVKIGESDPVPLPKGDRPLSGLRVLDLTRVLAGPTCGRTLAEYGAEVLRIGTSNPPDNPVMIRELGQGKRSAELDLKSSSGVAALESLLGDADVFSQGYRPGAVSGLGFSPEDVAQRRPGIIYVTESAFGHLGPWRERRGFDSVVQAATGIANELTDAESGIPHGNPATALDYSTGYMAAYATMMALQRRAEEGGSYHVRLSLAQTANWLFSFERADAIAAQERPRELSPERIAEITMVSETPFGAMRHLAPIAQLTETPGRWDRPTVSLDHDEPRWL